MWYPATYHGHHRQNKERKASLRLRRPIPLWVSDAGGFHLHQCVKASEQTHFILIITCKEQATTTDTFVLLLFASTSPAMNHSLPESSMYKNKLSFTVCGKQDRTGPLKTTE